MTVAHRLLVVLFLLYVVKQALTVLVFPSFTGHDEVAHYAHIRLVATEHRVPVIPDLETVRQSRGSGELHGDYLPDELYRYCLYVLDWDCNDDPEWKQNPPHIVTLGGELYPWGWQYTANHPPLYHVLMTPLYWLTESRSPVVQHYVFRFAAIPFGLFTVLLTFVIAQTLFRREPFLHVTAAAFVAFQPQVSYEAAMVNNDIVGIAAVTLVLYLTVRGLRDQFSPRLLVLLGTAIGLGLLAKSTTAIVLPGVALSIIASSGLRNIRLMLRRGVILAAVIAMLIWPWYLFLWRTYGNLSGLDQIAALQFRWTYRGQKAPTFTDQLFNSDIAIMRWRETWGEFGWRKIPLQDEMLLAIGIPCVLCLAGLVRFVWISRRSTVRESGASSVLAWQRIGLGALLLTCITAYGSVLQFGMRFQLTQARYFFPAIPAAAVLLMLGLRSLLPERGLRYGLAIVLIALFILNVLIYTQYVIPYWYLKS